MHDLMSLLLKSCPPPTNSANLIIFSPWFSVSFYRYLSDEGIAELKGSAEKITHNDIIRIALDVS